MTLSHCIDGKAIQNVLWYLWYLSKEMKYE